MKLNVNKNPAGRLNAFTFGLCNIADGLVRVLTLGFLFSEFALGHARNTARRRLEELKEKAAK